MGYWWAIGNINRVNTVKELNMKYLLFFLLSCSSVQQITKEHFNIYNYSNKDITSFADYIETYRIELIPLLIQCGIGDGGYDKVYQIIISESLPYGAGAWFDPPYTIAISAETGRMISYLGHEYVRAVLYWDSNELWSHPSNQIGWQSQYLACAWNAAETVSLNYKSIE